MSFLTLEKPARWALLLGVLLALPSLWVGMQLDDYFHWGLVTQRSQVLQTVSPASPYGLFSFVDGNPARVMDLMNLGLAPWWTYPEVEYAFWRPLTELTHGLDYSLWPQHPMLMHVHSMLYFALMLWCGFHLFKRLQGDSSAWLWAVFLFALSYTHGVPAGWLANRNAVLAVIFVLLTLFFHHQWRESDRGLLNLRASVCFTLGLLCGEMAVTAGAYLFAYAVLYENSPWRERLMSLSPYVVIGAAWLGMRSLLGYGASGSGHYVDLFQAPGLFLQVLVGRGLDLLGGLLWVVPPELGSGLPEGRRLVFLVLFLLLLWVAWPLLKADRRARFWLAGALFCLVPVASTIPHSRLLIAASIGAAGFLGLLIKAWRHGELAQSGLLRGLSGVLVAALLVLQLGLSALLLPLEMVSMRIVGDNYLNQGARSWDLADMPRETTPVLINPPLSSAGGYINGVRAYLGLPVASKTWLLASGLQPLTLTVLNAYTFDLYSREGLYDAVQEGVLRGPQAPFAVGDSVQLAGMIVTVMEVENGVPLRARFQFAHPINSERYRFSHWNSGQVAPCRLPPKNQSMELRVDSTQCAEP
ncbi:MAG: hypothetical protein VYA55_04365 [Pseudomonadota bacterium]|nr:hypothetical protein [Pseudomonadota bacterium]